MILHAYVKGAVQGVFFRASTKRIATKLGLRGWVKNLNDGRVEVTAEGPKTKLGELLEFLQKGPVGSRIIEVKYEYSNASGDYTNFEILQ